MPSPSAPEPARVVAMAQETHLAPPDALAPARQVVAAVLSGLPADVPPAAEPRPLVAPASVAHPAPASPEPLRMLRLELDPGNLGGVSISMRLAGNRLELEVEVDRGDTLALISKDREVLSRSLESSGYAVDALTVRSADVALAHPAAARGHDTPADASPQDAPRQDTARQDGARHDGARSERERDAAPRGRDDHPHNRRQDSHDKNRPRPPRGDVYV